MVKCLNKTALLTNMGTREKSPSEVIDEIMGIDRGKLPGLDGMILAETKQRFASALKDRLNLGDVPYILKLREGANVEAILAYCKEPSKIYSPNPAEIHYVSTPEHSPGFIYGHATAVMAELMFNCLFEPRKEVGADSSSEVECIAWYAQGLPTPPDEFKEQILEVVIP